MLTINSNLNEDGQLVFELIGRLDIMAAKDLDEAFVKGCEESSDIILEMGELEYIASAGLRTIKHLRNMVKDQGGTLVLRNVQDDIMDIFEMTGFAAMLTIE